ncbi:hypothetical protein FA95DRAFT_1201524 [Auriscalpium vulgare]|uniref:Uncharacterized protein n=1 Tax=Auriscalpium vulgare TaxID=40419 RepID=A0ACB8R4A2_9AGAM|nr:hypothetical protein FA95DRAFT_1201524 [Auriscalpium vulgare]
MLCQQCTSDVTQVRRPLTAFNLSFYPLLRTRCVFVLHCSRDTDAAALQVHKNIGRRPRASSPSAMSFTIIIGVGFASPEPLDPTLSAWLANMHRLAPLVERLHALALADPQQQQCALLQQVAVLRAMLKKQQARCIAFLQLAQEYADRYLRDISADIQAQHALLGVLERRLGAARELHTEVAALRRSFVEGTCGGLKDICALGTSPFDSIYMRSWLNGVVSQRRKCRFPKTRGCLRS